MSGLLDEYVGLVPPSIYTGQFTAVRRWSYTTTTMEPIKTESPGYLWLLRKLVPGIKGATV